MDFNILNSWSIIQAVSYGSKKIYYCQNRQRFYKTLVGAKTDSLSARINKPKKLDYSFVYLGKNLWRAATRIEFLKGRAAAEF
jgi:hypothetical protein